MSTKYYNILRNNVIEVNEEGETTLIREPKTLEATMLPKCYDQWITGIGYDGGHVSADKYGWNTRRINEEGNLPEGCLAWKDETTAGRFTGYHPAMRVWKPAEGELYVRVYLSSGKWVEDGVYPIKTLIRAITLRHKEIRLVKLADGQRVIGKTEKEVSTDSSMFLDHSKWAWGHGEIEFSLKMLDLGIDPGDASEMVKLARIASSAKGAQLSEAKNGLTGIAKKYGFTSIEVNPAKENWSTSFAYKSYSGYIPE